MAKYIYILHHIEFINEDIDIYNIVSSKKLNHKSDNKTKIIFGKICNEESELCLQLIISLFNSKYIQAKNIGPNFFYGNYRRMIKDIENITKLFIKDEQFIKTIDEYIIDQLNKPDKSDIFKKYGIDSKKKLIY